MDSILYSTLCCLFFFTVWHPISVSCNTVISCTAYERDALLTVKNELLVDEGSAFRFLSWRGSNCCEWEGVQCSGFNSHVIQLRLEGGGSPSRGSLSPALGRLKNLEYLDLSNNYLTGVIPGGFFELKHLKYLDLSFNSFGGNILEGMGSLLNLTHLNLNNQAGFMETIPVPTQLGNLSHLQFLDISVSIWDSPSLDWVKNLQKLKHLSLGGTYLSMSGERLGESISGLSNLEYLDVNQCKLWGSIPTSLRNLTSLAYLSLTRNQFSSQIPSWLENMTYLDSLLLNANNFSGPLPPRLSSLPNLRTLDLSLNPYLSGDIGQILDGPWRHLSTFFLGPSQISGNLPSSIGNISSLTILALPDMKINGSIPSSVANLSALGDLDLSWNHLQGNVSLDSFQNNTSLIHLSLSHNDLTVRTDLLWIPKIQFSTLYLASCNIGGSIPPFLSTQDWLLDLDLSSNNLFGSIPSWFEEHTLQSLNLSYNNLVGQLSSNIDLTLFDSLDLHHNSLTGPLPISLGQRNLRVLDLSHNKFTGIIPKEIDALLPKIEFFSCSDNDLSGGIPTSIGNLQNLLVLDVSQNTLSGTIPQSITNCSFLWILNLANSNLTGHIPSDIGRLQSLESLHLNGNRLAGNLPRSLLDCLGLKILDAGNNFLSGKIPYWLGGLSELMILILAANQFHGYIPPELSNLSALHVLDISNNRLMGPIPRDLGKLAAMLDGHFNISDTSYMSYYYKEEVKVTVKDKELEYSSSVLLLITGIDLSGNKLSGEIPSVIGKLKGLHALNISRNNLRGKIPMSFATMEQLESLDLSCNKLQGSIPLEMLQLSFLVIFNVSHNMLGGKIPTGGQFSTFNESLFVGNPGLCGFPLNRTCEPGKTREMIPEEEEYEYEDGIPWHWYVEWMASFAAGFWGVFVLIYVRQSWRRRYFQALDRVVARFDGVVLRFMISLTN